MDYNQFLELLRRALTGTRSDASLLRAVVQSAEVFQDEIRVQTTDGGYITLVAR